MPVCDGYLPASQTLPDGDDRHIVAFEFDDDIEILSEMRVDPIAWEKENFFISRAS
jgi:hypothetical protein